MGLILSKIADFWLNLNKNNIGYFLKNSWNQTFAIRLTLSIFFKIAKNHTFSIGVTLYIFVKNSQKSHIFDRGNPIDFREK